ncbi:MAG: hypothetical protein LBR28_04955 [Bacteroidales bacterium]|jgi:hypothetical protein|nr:hypothetical protein [Bacteroidales bacterium]
MKKLILIVLLAFGTLTYAQTKKGLFAEVQLGFSFISNTNNINNYFSNIYSDYKSGKIIAGNAGIVAGWQLFNRFSVMLETKYYSGSPLRRDAGNQYITLSGWCADISAEFAAINAENWALSAKAGIGYDISTFFYSRKNPLIIKSYSYGNIFAPVILTCWIKNSNNNRHAFGIFAQYNVLIAKGKANITGLDYEENVPNVSMNSIEIGIRSRF